MGSAILSLQAEFNKATDAMLHRDDRNTDHPLSGVDEEFEILLEMHDPLSCSSDTFDYLFEQAPNARVRAWLMGFHDCRAAIATIAGIRF